VHNQKDANISTIGYIAARDIIGFFKVKPLKKTKVETPNQKPKSFKKGTTAYHIVKFMESAMDMMNKNDMKGHLIVMDNCKIHHSRFVADSINSRGYKPLFIPLYSPFFKSY
jgi:hypothetical protein